MGNATFADIRKKCEVENDAEGLKTYFPTEFGIIFWNFRQIFFIGRGGLGGYRILSLYIGSSPYFPNWSGPIFPHGPMELPIIRHWRPLVLFSRSDPVSPHGRISTEDPLQPRGSHSASGYEVKVGIIFTTTGTPWQSSGPKKNVQTVFA